MSADEQLARLSEITRRALSILGAPGSSPAEIGNATQVLAQAGDLRIRIITTATTDASTGESLTGAPGSADPMTRAHAPVRASGDDERQASGLRKLREGRDQCGARRRDGGACLAPAVDGALRCRRHGGATVRVRIRAAHLRLLGRAYMANQAFLDARGTPGEFDALCAAVTAQRDLDDYETRLRRLRELRAEVKRLRAEHEAAGPAAGER